MPKKKKKKNCSFKNVCNGRHTIDNVSQNKIPEGYAGRKQSALWTQRGLVCRAVQDHDHKFRCFFFFSQRNKSSRKENKHSPKSSSLCVALYICLSFWSCFSIFLFASLCAFSSFLWSSVLLLPKQPIFPQGKKLKKWGVGGPGEEEEVEGEEEEVLLVMFEENN